MKKNRLIQWTALLLTGALLLCFAACRKGPPPEEIPPEQLVSEPDTTTEVTTTTASTLGVWRIELRGVENVLFFSSEDAQYLPKVQFEMTTTSPETGLSSRNTYGVITLRSLLNYCGVQNVVGVTVTSRLGTFATYNDVMAMAEDTILAWEIDGTRIPDDPPLRMCPRSSIQPTDFVKQVSSLNIVPTTAPIVYDPVLNSDPNQIMPTSSQPFSAPPMGHTNDYNYTTTTRPTDTTTTESTTTTTTTTTTTRPPRTTKPWTDYVGPTKTTTTSMTKPPWWPAGVEWPPED